MEMYAVALSDSVWIQVQAIPTLVSVTYNLISLPRAGSTIDRPTLTAVGFARSKMAETTIQGPKKLPEPQAIILSIHSSQLGLAVIVSCLDVYGIHYIPYNVFFCSLIIASGSVCLERQTLLTLFLVSLHNYSVRLSHRFTMLLPEALQYPCRRRLPCMDARLLAY
jgi:hypothetical protein